MNDDMLEIMSFSQNQIVGRIPWFLFFDGVRWRTNLMSLYFAEFQPYDIFVFFFFYDISVLEKVKHGSNLWAWLIADYWIAISRLQRIW